eukprot:Skav206249  [mRNA]  locus=scaffold1425:238619:248039:- [translate_table: standard]
MPSIVYCLNIFILLAARGAGAVNLFGTRALSERAAEKLEHEVQWGPLGDIASSATKTLANAADAAAKISPTCANSQELRLGGDMVVDNFDLPPPSNTVVNHQVIVCIIAAVAVISVGLLLDVLLGLITTLFQFLLGVELLGAKVILTQEDGEYSAITELILYAMVVPTVKIAALLLGELWRENPDPRKVHTAKAPVTSEEMDDVSRPWVLRTFGAESQLMGRVAGEAFAYALLRSQAVSYEGVPLRSGEIEVPASQVPAFNEALSKVRDFEETWQSTVDRSDHPESAEADRTEEDGVIAESAQRRDLILDLFKEVVVLW